MSKGKPIKKPVRQEPPKAEMLEAAVAELLRVIPETWQAYKPDDLSETKAKGLFLLTAAGMVERRERLRLRFANHPVVAEATITFTGEYGGIEALEPLVANLWADWQDAYAAWKDSDAANVSPSHCERLEPSEWRLTDQGVIARKALDASEHDQGEVFDFVLKRGLFDGRRHRAPNGHVCQRKPVRGKGSLVKFDKVKADVAGLHVNIGNWSEGGDAFAQTFGPVFVKMFEAAMQAQSKPAAPDESKPKGELSPRVAKRFPWANLPNDPITLDQFMVRFCEKRTRESRRCRREALLGAARNETVVMPPLATRKSGQSNKYFTHDLLNAWQGFIDDKNVHLPPLLPQYQHD